MSSEEENKKPKHFSGKYITDENFVTIYKYGSVLFLFFVMYWVYKFNQTGSKNMGKGFPKETKMGGILASERTFLSYTRTSVSFVGLGIAFYKMFENKIMKILSIFMMLVAVCLIIFGNISYMENTHSVAFSKTVSNRNFSMFIFTFVLVSLILLILFSTNEENVISLLDGYLQKTTTEEEDKDMIAMGVQQITTF